MSLKYFLVRKMSLPILFVGTWQIVIIVLVILLLFGGRKIPELMKGLGKGIKEFKDATDGNDDDDNNEKKNIKDN